MGTISIKEVRIPVAALRAQPVELRHTYYLLAHVFNELMCLQKLIHFAFPKGEEKHQPVRTAEMSQALFLFRIACAKIHEAKVSWDQVEVAKTLTDMVLPLVPNGSEMRKTINRQISSASWLPALRNEGGFHYPKMREWRRCIEPDEHWEDDLVHLSDKTGNTFYDAANSVVQQWMFELHSPDEPSSAVDPMITEMISLLSGVTNYLEKVLVVLVSDIFLNGEGEAQFICDLRAPDFKKVSLPFWTRMPPESSDVEN